MDIDLFYVVWRSKVLFAVAMCCTTLSMKSVIIKKD